MPAGHAWSSRTIPSGQRGAHPVRPARREWFAGCHPRPVIAAASGSPAVIPTRPARRRPVRRPSAGRSVGGGDRWDGTGDRAGSVGVSQGRGRIGSWRWWRWWRASGVGAGCSRWTPPVDRSARSTSSTICPAPSPPARPPSVPAGSGRLRRGGLPRAAARRGAGRALPRRRADRGAAARARRPVGRAPVAGRRLRPAARAAGPPDPPARPPRRPVRPGGAVRRPCRRPAGPPASSR